MGEPLERRAVERGIRRDHRQSGIPTACRVRGLSAKRRRPARQVRERVDQRTVGPARTRQDLPGTIHDVPDGVHDDEGADGDVATPPTPPTPSGGRPRAHPAFHRGARSERLPNGGARSRADAALGDIRRRGRAGPIGVVRDGPAVRLAARGQIEVEDHCRGDDGHDPRRPYRQPAPALAQPAHHTVRGAQAVGGSTGEENRVYAIDQMMGVEGIELPRAGGAPADDARGAHAAVGREYDRAAGRAWEVGPMTDGHPADVGDTRGNVGRGHGSAKIRRLARVVEVGGRECCGRAAGRRHRRGSVGRSDTCISVAHVNACLRFTTFAALVACFGGEIACGTDRGASRLPAVFTAGQANRGRHVYGASCAWCHGRRLEGSAAPALAGPAFLRRWRPPTRSAADLYNLVNTSMPKLAMGSLASDDYTAVFAYLLQRNGWPAGSREFDGSDTLLRAI